MLQVKVRIFQPSVVRNRLKLMGAHFLGSWTEKDTYFLQPAGCFLKIERIKGSASLVKMCRQGAWGLKEEKRLRDAVKEEEKLSKKFGVEKVIEKRVHSYSYGGTSIGIHSLSGVGDFLVLEGKLSAVKPILKKLGIEKPEFVSLAFSELA